MNRIKVSLHQSIVVLAGRGWSNRQIARELGLDGGTVSRQLGAANTATNPAHGERPGPASKCTPHTAVITAAVQAGLSARRTYQDLRSDHGFAGGYSSVKAFVRRLGATVELPFRRMEVEPGAEIQFDFGTGAWVISDGKRRRPHLFRAVLSHSRKG